MIGSINKKFKTKNRFKTINNLQNKVIKKCYARITFLENLLFNTDRS